MTIVGTPAGTALVRPHRTDTMRVRSVPARGAGAALDEGAL